MFKSFFIICHYYDYMIDEIMKQILDKFSEDKIVEMLDDEILNWVDPEWEEEHENQYEWYGAYGRGEAEQEIRRQMMVWWETKYQNTEIYQQYKQTKDAEIKLEEAIINDYDFLKDF